MIAQLPGGHGARLKLHGDLVFLPGIGPVIYTCVAPGEKIMGVPVIGAFGGGVGPDGEGRLVVAVAIEGGDGKGEG